MKQVSIATIMRQELTRVGLWVKGSSKTRYDSMYSRNMISSRWVSELLVCDDRFHSPLCSNAVDLVNSIKKRINDIDGGSDVLRVLWSGTKLAVYVDTKF